VSDAPREMHEWDAAYVLGGLTSRERATYERHLESCAACTASVAELAGVPGLLASVPIDEAVELLDEAPHETAPRQVAVGRPLLGRHWASIRRPRRVLVALGTAAVVVVGAGGYAIGAAGDPAAPAPSAALSASSAKAMTPTQGSAISAELAVSAKSWGTRFDWTFRDDRGTASSRVYDLVAIANDGTRTVVATWSAVDGTAGGLVAASSLPTESLVAVEIVVAARSTVVATVDV
jgi:hypothetical protein